MPAKLSLRAVWLSCALLLLLRIAEHPRHAIGWDVFGYYLYLPATVIHEDVALRDRVWLDTLMTTYQPSSTLYQLVEGPDGSRVIKYSSGMALLYAPFFLLAHTVAPLLGHPADGLSPPYVWIITYGCLAFALLGLFVLRKLLLHFFSDRWTAALVLLIALGTNHLQLTAWDGTLLTHSALFTLYGLLLLATLRWHERPTWSQALLIGAAAGWITLIRPSEGVCLLIPLLWAPQGKWALIRSHFAQVAGAAVVFSCIAGLQAVYWKQVTGQWLFYSYDNPGEGFEFASPYWREFLFSFRKGWLLYTPLMAFAVIGLPLLWQRQRRAFWAITVFFLVDLWVISSWSCWWYAGGSFSSRSLVAAYPVLAVPLGFALQGLFAWRWARRAGTVLVAGFVLLNLFQTLQWHLRVLPKDRVTGAYYAAIFGRLSVPPDAERTLMVDRSTGTEEHLADTSAYHGRLLFSDDFADRPEGAITLSAADPYSPGPDLPFHAITAKDHAWLRISTRLQVPDTVRGLPPVIVVAFHHEGRSYKYRTATWPMPLPEGAREVPLTMDYLTPEVRSTADNMKIYLWAQDGSTWRVDDLQVQVFEPK